MLVCALLVDGLGGGGRLDVGALFLLFSLQLGQEVFALALGRSKQLLEGALLLGFLFGLVGDVVEEAQLHVGLLGPQRLEGILNARLQALLQEARLLLLLVNH